MRFLLPSLLLSLLFCAVALAFSLGMGQVRGDWLFAAVILAVALGLLTGPVLVERRG